MRHSSSVNLRPSRPRNDQMYTRTLGVRKVRSFSRHSRNRSNVIPRNPPESYSRDEGTGECEREDDAKVAEKVFLRAPVLLWFSAQPPFGHPPRPNLTCFSSYPEFRMIGGNSRLKNNVCLNDCVRRRFRIRRVNGHACRPRRLASISRIRCPGDSRMTRPTTIPDLTNTGRQSRYEREPD
jgi:hypothetical protein